MHDDDGFTLIELLIAVTMLGIIIGAVSTGLIVMFTTTEETTQRLSESPDLQIAAAYFGSDVQSASTLVVPVCGTSTTILTAEWEDPKALPATSDDTTRTVVYSVVMVGNQKQLVRSASIDGGVVDTTTLVNFLKPTSSPCPVQSGTPTSVNLPLEVCTADAANVCKNTALSFELKATRRTA